MTNPDIIQYIPIKSRIVLLLNNICFIKYEILTRDVNNL